MKRRLMTLLASLAILIITGQGLAWACAGGGGGGHHHGHGDGTHKVTICHRTHSVTNPYVRITVDDDAVNGDSGNDKGKGDHSTHTGRVFDASANYHGSDKRWGDIIPPNYDNGTPGYWTPLNWSNAGQAIWFNDCKVPTKVTPTPPVVTQSQGCGQDGWFEVAPGTGYSFYLPSGEKVVPNQPYYGAVDTTLTAVADAHFEISGPNTFQVHIEPAAKCPIQVTPVHPTVHQFTKCGTSGFYWIPTQKGVTYLFNGNIVSAGRHYGDVTGTITAEADQGYVLNGSVNVNVDIVNNKACAIAPHYAPKAHFWGPCGDPLYRAVLDNSASNRAVTFTVRYYAFPSQTWQTITRTVGAHKVVSTKWFHAMRVHQDWKTRMTIRARGHLLASQVVARAGNYGTCQK